MSNVPDGWNRYWSKCQICGRRYHESDGGCGCTDDLDSCSCGENEWIVDDGVILCSRCKTQPGSPPRPPDEEEEELDKESSP